MSLDTSIFSENGPGDRAETRAIIVAALLSLVFIAFLGVAYKSRLPRSKDFTPNKRQLTSTPPVKVEEPKEAADDNEKFRVVPENFKHIDFQNWSYGNHRSLETKLTLVEGERDYPSKEGGGGDSFFLKDVYYADVTNDERPEAIVILWHLQCGGSCDGGSALVYIYGSEKALKKLWQYETGSMAYGCGLKSLTITKTEIVLEMFGKCWQPEQGYSGSGKYLVDDSTRSIFQFNGTRFVRRQTEVMTSPTRNLKQFTPEVTIKL
jgi:hypothetical protein